DYMNMS
nr:Chain B, 6-mer peptide from Insulin receptor substrate 1 [Homo sapiens]